MDKLEGMGYGMFLEEVKSLRARISELQNALLNAVKAVEYCDDNGDKWCGLCQNSCKSHHSDCVALFASSLNQTTTESIAVQNILDESKAWVEQVKREAKEEVYDAIEKRIALNVQIDGNLCLTQSDLDKLRKGGK